MEHAESSPPGTRIPPRLEREREREGCATPAREQIESRATEDRPGTLNNMNPIAQVLLMPELRNRIFFEFGGLRHRAACVVRQAVALQLTAHSPVLCAEVLLCARYCSCSLCAATGPDARDTWAAERLWCAVNNNSIFEADTVDYAVWSHVKALMARTIQEWKVCEAPVCAHYRTLVRVRGTADEMRAPLDQVPPVGQRYRLTWAGSESRWWRDVPVHSPGGWDAPPGVLGLLQARLAPDISEVLAIACSTAWDPWGIEDPHPLGHGAYNKSRLACGVGFNVTTSPLELMTIARMACPPDKQPECTWDAARIVRHILAH